MKPFWVLLISLVSVLDLSGQYLFHLEFRGTAYETNAAGEMLARPLTEQILLSEVLSRAGITDPAGYALVYHVNGHTMGDTLDIVSATGVTLDTVYGLYFGEAFGRVGITNAPGSAAKRIDYIYDPDVNPNSIGAALVTMSTVTNDAGNTMRSYQGTMHWVSAPRGTNRARICTGRFQTTRPFTAGGVAGATGKRG